MRPEGFQASICLLLSCLLLLLAHPAAAGEPPGELPPPGVTRIPDQFIVVLDDRVADVGAAARDIAARTGGRVGHTYRFALKGFVIRLPAGADPDQILRDPRVAFIEQDSVATLFDHVAAEVPTGVNRINAELNRTTGAGTGLGVAVIDTGIQLTHPDLNVVGHVTFVRGTKSGNDDNGHGTHVAGTIGAKDDGVGVVGVAPGVALYAVKVLDRNGSGAFGDVIKGVDWVTQNAAKIAVANMSLGGSLANADDGNCGNTNGDALHRAVCGSVSAGVVYAVAAGNSSSDAKDFRPAAYREVITVSALADSNGLPDGGGPATGFGADDTFATFSNFGAAVDVIAPGVNIRSTCIGSSYCTKSGTSMASPHGAGAAALWIVVNGRPATANASDPAFRNGLLAGVSEAVGPFRGDPDGTAEPMVNADTLQTGGTGSSVCCPAP